MNQHYDIIIIGGGVAACEAAEIAARDGYSVLLLEKDKLGGTCLNSGCIPSKYYLSLAHDLEQLGVRKEQGLLMGEVNPDFGRIARKQRQVIAKMSEGVHKSLLAAGVDILWEEAATVKVLDDGIAVFVKDKLYYAGHIIIATGTETRLPALADIEEEIDNGFVMTSRTLFEIQQLPESMVIIGGGIAGIEMAYAFAGFGTDVTVVEMADEILSSVDREYRQEIKNLLSRRGIRFVVQANVTAVCEGSVFYTTGKEEYAVECDMVYLCTGRKPVSRLAEGLLKMDQQGFIITDQQYETNQPNIYAIGDVNGKSLLAHSAISQAKTVIDWIRSGAIPAKVMPVPQVIYLRPEYAQTGESEDSAVQKGLAFEAVRCSMNYSGRFVATHGEMYRYGSIKLLIGADEVIIGACVFCMQASEIITIIQVMMAEKISCRDIADYIFPHPTEGEIIRKCVSLYYSAVRKEA